MRKPRDFDAELKALETKAQQLRQRKVAKLGELVVATGADALPIEELAGTLIAAARVNDLVSKQEWQTRRCVLSWRTQSSAPRWKPPERRCGARAHIVLDF